MTKPVAIAHFASALDDDNVRAFLDVIRACEGTSGQNGYRTHFGGTLFDSFDDHPRVVITARLGRRPISSSAAGAYQILQRTWDGLRKQYDFADFSPPQQDAAAVALIAGRSALRAVQEGLFDRAIALCAKEWASLPGSPYGQPTKELAWCRARYASAGGIFAPAGHPAGTVAPVVDMPPTPIKETQPMAPIVGMLVKAALGAAPELARIYRQDDATPADKNTAAGLKIAEIAMQATGAVNEQQAADLITHDTAAREDFRQAVKDQWFELQEAGGGGIEGARAFADKHADGRYGRVIEYVTYCALGFLFLANIAVGGGAGIALWHESSYAQQLLNMVSTIVQADIGAAMIAFGFWLGSSVSKSRGTEVKTP